MTSYRAKTSAKLLLEKVMKNRHRLAPSALEAEILKDLPDLIAQDVWRLNVVRKPLLCNDINIAGVLDRSKKLVEISTNFSLGSQRFSYAHELGHYVLHTGLVHFRDRNPDMAGPKSVEEVEADVFAAELLMPSQSLRDAYERLFGSRDSFRLYFALIQCSAEEAATSTKWDRAMAIAVAPTSHRLKSLSEIYFVSQTAMARRLIELGLVT